MRWLQITADSRNMRGSLTWLLLSAVGFAVAVRSAYAAAPADSVRLAQEVDEARARLGSVCAEASKYGNLRPTLTRVEWAKKFVTPLQPSEAVTDLTVASSYYRMLVGEMAYWGWVCCSRSQRLRDCATVRGASAAEKEIPSAERDWDYAMANYLRACAWAWPYANLRPKCLAAGLEPASFLNPLIPTPDNRVALSSADPDFPVIVAALDEWKPRVQFAARRLKILLEDRQSAADAAKRAQGNPPTLGTLQDGKGLSLELNLSQIETTGATGDKF